MEENLLGKINEIKDRADIVDIIGRRVSLVKKGKNYFGLCPFHNDNHPSMSVSPDKQIFRCFVCNESGTVFSFLQKYEKIPYMKAVKEVADIVGIEFKTSEPKQTEVIPPKKKALFDLLNDANLFYKNSLVSSKEALDYCSNRDLELKTINEFNIGYSPDYDKLVTYLLSKGYTKDDIYRSGLVIENNGELKDRFAKRLIFPITNLDGKIVAFSGRIIEKSDMAKYVNSPETDIFTKGETLYNYSNAINHIKQQKQMYICEGYMDCIALNKAGITNAVALMGTAFTKEHLKLFKYLGVEYVLCLDGDDPGNINANHLANELLDQNCNVKVIPSYKDCKDLDEYLHKYGGESLVNHLNEVKMNAFDFNFYVAKKLHELENNENKKKFLKKMCLKISTMDDSDIDIYSNKLHDELGFSMSTITNLVKEFKSKKDTEENAINVVNNYKKHTKYQELQIRIISSMLDSPEAIELFIDNLVYLSDEKYRKLANIISEYYEENKANLNMDHLLADLFTKVETEFASEDDIAKALIEIDSAKENYPTYNSRAFNDLLYEIKEIAPLEEQIAKIEEDMKFSNSPEQKNDLIRKSISLKAQLKVKMAKKGK